jgi:hypothetical protein
MDEAADIDAGVGKDAVRRTKLLMDERKRLLYLGFVSDVTSQTNRSARTLDSRQLGSLFCALSVLI